MTLLQDLQSVAKNFTILYVEDNKALREKAKILLEKFFSHVDLAANGREGLEMFVKKHYQIVITDIKMPQMDGMELTQEIKRLQPETKVIIMSAFDKKEFLFRAIELGVFRFLSKPVNLNELAKVLTEAIDEIKHEQHTKIFYSYLKNIFEYQSALVVMLHKEEVLLANDNFLEFFNFETLSDCKASFHTVTQKFLAHDKFLYEHDDVHVLSTLMQNPQKLFHVKLLSQENELKHFILKYQDIPHKEGYGILSFDDVTQLQLLALFDAKQSKQDELIVNKKGILNLLEVIRRNSAKVEVHNYYKGLSITNSGIVSEVTQESAFFKTSYIQLKAMQLEQQTYIYSSALPYVLLAQDLVKMSFEQQEFEFSKLSFVQSSPLERSTIRVVPDERQSVSLFLGENKFFGDISIEDISLDAVKLRLSALPAGLNEQSDIILDIVLEMDKRPFIINTKAKLLKKSESKHSFSVVFMFEDVKKSALVKYITKRQMALIREIKGMQNG